MFFFLTVMPFYPLCNLLQGVFWVDRQDISKQNKIEEDWSTIIKQALCFSVYTYIDNLHQSSYLILESNGVTPEMKDKVSMKWYLILQ